MGMNGHLNGVALSPQERLQARLAEPATVDALNALLDKLDVVNFAVGSLDGFLRRGDQVAENLADSMADLRKLAPADSANLVEKLPKLARAGAQMADVIDSAAVRRLAESGLLDQLGKPETIAALRALLDKIELLSFAASALDGFLRRGDEIADALAAGADDLRKASSDEVKSLVAALPKFARAGNELADSGLLDQAGNLARAASSLASSGLLDKLPQITATADTLVNSGIFNPRTVGILADAGKTLADSYEEARQAKPRPVGLTGLLGALRDADIQRSLGLLLDFAKRFGQKLK